MKNEIHVTPSFVLDQRELSASLVNLRWLSERAFCRPLFSAKACSLCAALGLICEHVDGISASSVFEAKLGAEFAGKRLSLHLSTPGIRPEELPQIAETCDYVSFGSLSQWERFMQHLAGKIECGLRVNPGLSFVEDPRYDPCRRASKLGVPFAALTEMLEEAPQSLTGVSGIHFHNNCDSADLSELLETVQHVDRHLEPLLRRLEWVNIGGGYLPNEAETLDPFYEAVGLLRDRYGVEVFFEPGAGIVRSAGFLVSSVLDLFESGGKVIVILDTSVNHMPEVFEYQFEPDVAGHKDDGRYQYVLAGCTCLAGDLFGEYAFDEPLEIGSRVVFTNAGAYTTVKWHMFNGINLPAIYALTEDSELVLKRRFTYEDFASRCGVEPSALIGT